MDDTLVHSRDFTSHLAHLDQALGCLGNAGILLRADKCKFAYQEVQFLGHLISGVVRNRAVSTHFELAQSTHFLNELNELVPL